MFRQELAINAPAPTAIDCIAERRVMLLDAVILFLTPLLCFEVVYCDIDDGVPCVRYQLRLRMYKMIVL